MANEKIFLAVVILAILLGAMTVLHVDVNSIATQFGKYTDKDRTKVSIKDHQLWVNGHRFIVKGVGYSPVPIGKDPAFSPHGDYFTYKYKDIYERDLPLLRKMGANVVRIRAWNSYDDHTDFLNKAYNNGKDPIYVMLSFWIDPKSNISSPDVRKKVRSDFKEMVRKYKNHPAILMWVIGNELNARWKNNKNKMDDLFSLLDEMASDAHAEEGNNYHPVTTALVDAKLIDTMRTYDQNMTHLDIWGVQLYRGKTFGSFFDDYSKVSNKPVIILEFGIDAYDDVHHTEYEDIQAAYAESLWKDIERHLNIAVGGIITAYTDQWWKGRGARPQNKSYCPDYDASLHSDCGNYIGSHPDKYSNEEWWGIMGIRDNGDAPDIVEPRDAYYTLMKLWKNEDVQ